MGNDAEPRVVTSAHIAQPQAPRPGADAFVGIPGGRRTWAVASIYGDDRRLAHVHRQLIERLKPEDNLVYLGNVLGRGDAILATVHELLLFRRALMAHQIETEAGAIVYLRGSQEEMWQKLLQLQFAPNPRQVFEWMLTQGVGATLEAYGGRISEGRTAANSGAQALSRWTGALRSDIRGLDGHERLMSTLKRAAYTEDEALLFVNAGLDPARPLPNQGDNFWWRSGDFERMNGPYFKFRRVIRGADPRHRGIVEGDFTTSIDGGCGSGGPLIAACFAPSGKIVDKIEA